jgi:hypothetical protein
MKYKIADLFVVPHYNDHDQPGSFIIAECCGVEKKSNLIYYRILYAGETMTYKMYEVDIKYYMENCEYIYYPSK